MSKVFLSPVHSGGDTGAVGNLVKNDVNLKKAKDCADSLSERGILKTQGVNTVAPENVVTETENEAEGYLVKVTTAALNVRKGPGTAYQVCHVILDEGVYTIIEEKNVGGIKWGRLKSGVGWIALSFTERL